MALMWHPDKNQGSSEAEERFKKIQHAYEVLSDIHERSWYDAHRDQILSYTSARTETSSWTEYYETPKDSSPRIDIFRYFSSSAFSGFGDDARGFFHVFRVLFESIAEIEEQASKQQKAPPTVFPSFGFSSNTTKKDLDEFYARWSAFVSAQTFAEEDKWNLAGGDNRWERRRMEDENKKARARAQREFNEQVRELVRFVKRRDPRVLKVTQEEKMEREEREKKKQEEKKKEAVKCESNQDAQDTRRHDESDDAHNQAVDEMLAELLREGEISRNRRKSKEGGKSAPRDLITQRDQDDAEADTLVSRAAAEDQGNAEEQHMHGAREGDKCCTGNTTMLHLTEEIRMEGSNQGLDACQETCDAASIKDNRHGHGKRSKQKQNRTQSGSACENQQQQHRHGTRRVHTHAVHHQGNATQEQGGHALDQMLVAHSERINGSTSRKATEEIIEWPPPKKIGMAKLKRMKRALRAAAASEDRVQVLDDSDREDDQDVKDSNTKSALEWPFCRVCRSTFSSRNKLFDHIKATGHALHTEDVNAGNVPRLTKDKKGSQRRRRANVEAG